MIIIALAGNRDNSNGSLNNQGANGNYWSSSVTGTNAFNLNFNSGGVNPANNNNRANGFSVRCVKDLQTMRKTVNQQLILDLFRAYFDTRKNKGNTANALAFEADYEKKLFALHDDIVNRKYEIGQSICFVVKKPVRREIFAADFRDRIVHHLIFNAINQIFEKNFIKDSYSCRVGKGTSFGIKRIDHFVKSCSENYQKDSWILKLDISGYFMSMDREILFAKIEKKLRNHFLVARFTTGDLAAEKAELDLLLYLIEKVIFNDPTKNCFVKGKREDWVGMPRSKSLFCAKKGSGFPIGNLTSQLFGNIYLDSFDHFVREELGVKKYGRYVDDMVFVHQDKEFLKKVILKVGKYLQEELSLTLHPKKIYLQHGSRGVAFLGAIIKPRRIYVASRTKNNFYAKMREYNVAIAGGKFFGEKEIKKFIACTNSYLGIMKHYETFRLRKKMVEFLNVAFWKHVSVAENFEKVEILKEKIVNEDRCYIKMSFWARNVMRTRNVILNLFQRLSEFILGSSATGSFVKQRK